MTYFSAWVFLLTINFNNLLFSLSFLFNDLFFFFTALILWFCFNISKISLHLTYLTQLKQTQITLVCDDKTCIMTCISSEDQPGHQPSDIRFYIMGSLGSYKLMVSLCRQQWLIVNQSMWLVKILDHSLNGMYNYINSGWEFCMFFCLLLIFFFFKMNFFKIFLQEYYQSVTQFGS